MDFDWCTDEDLKNTTIFNDESIIISKFTKKVENKEEIVVVKKDSINPNDCFNLKMTIENHDDLLNIMHYLSGVSNYLRNQIRGKGTKQTENSSVLITVEEFEMILKYLYWLKTSSEKVKDFFAQPIRKDNSHDPNSIKPFKTSSYKFCNYNETCSVHKNKNKNCDKNHFVFDMIINDITKLIGSIELIGLEHLNWTLINNSLFFNYDDDIKTFIISKNINNNIEFPDRQFIVDKNLISKSFDVVSFVLNKMYEESKYFLNYKIQSLQIFI
jgi:hypothetical protein